MGKPLRVFCSYRSSDGAVVEEFARRLRAEAGIDAWLDQWEISPGDDIVARMDAGLDGCDAALVFLSRSWPAGAWARDEDSTLWYRRIEDRIRVIPVVVDELPEDTPARLAKLARRTIEQFDEIRDALLGVDRRPGLANATAARLVVASLAVSEQQDGTARVAVAVDGRPAVVSDVSLPAGLGLEDGASALVLGEIGRRVGRLLYPGAVGEAVERALDELRVGDVLELRVTLEGARVEGVAVEAGLLPSGRGPALEPGVRVTRIVGGFGGRLPQPAPGPLKVLVAVGAPDEGLTRSAPLDIEAEMGSILAAVGQAVTDGRAQVRVLEIANTDTIAAALREDAYHVVHLSGHGHRDAIELETEDGGLRETSAADLARAFRASGAAVPLVFLSSCHGAGDSAGLAAELVRAGVPRVVAMQARVTDTYATELGRAFYEALSRSPWPRAGIALADARRDVHARPGSDSGRPAEWPTATLLLGGDDAPLLDSDLDQVPLRRPPVLLPATAAVPALDWRRLVGRRREVRETLRALRADSAFTSEHGDVGGVALTGIGGVGKSTVAGRVIARLSEQRWVCSAVTGEWSLRAVCAQLASDLAAAPQVWAGALAARLTDADEDDQRLAALRAALQYQVLFVFDNYEDNLTPDGGAFLDAATRASLQALIDAAAVGKLLMTSRHPPPGVDGMHRLAVGPLSAAESRRLWLRLPALELLAPEDQRLVASLIGGHPRMLELLDALLRRGASVAQIRPKLRDLAERERVDVSAQRDLTAAISDATRLGARDILLDELLAALDAGEREVLLQAAVSSLATTLDDLASMLPDHDVPGAARRLRELSLLVDTDDGVWVHRWTAEALREHQSSDEHRERCRRAGESRVRRIQAGSVSVVEGIEATENLLAAGDLDVAAAVGLSVAEFLRRSSTSWLLSFTARTRQALPSSHPSYRLFADHEATSLLSLGFTRPAIERYAELTRDFERLAAAEPDRVDYQRELSVFYDRLGDLLDALGEGEQARRYHTQGLEIAERLAAAEPDRADYQRDLSISYNKLGDLLGALGEGEQARRYYMQGLEIRQRLAAAEPARADYQRDLSVSYERLGDLLGALGESEQARRYHTQGLEIRQGLAAAEPASADYERDLFVSYNKLGDLWGALGEGEQAGEYYMRGLEIAERLAAADPDRVDYQRDLSVSFNRLGDLLGALGEGEQARRYYVQALEIAERLAAAEPDRADYQRDLSIAYNNLGDLWGVLGEGEQARRYYVQGLEISKRLATAEPNRVDYQRDLSIAESRLAEFDAGQERGRDKRRGRWRFRRRARV